MKAGQIVDGELRDIQDICLSYALRIYNERSEIDTNPKIVRMIFRGNPINHWYYRSDQWIDQPYFFGSVFIQPCIGPPEQACPVLYGEGTYETDEEIMGGIDVLMEMFHKSL